ncbi:AAA family ATPase [Gordonia polyisoprenivorans]|uniref:AAA family ATPase n=1 Tax=Gordonia polyisoprenivorans TaxID=84595 RepID=UPI001AD70FB4|nr:AAA family ATPase [Gordonia polyisoprenivorans]QTI67474.1 AAA family ATPase [Gordonia polyisoprenivorans]
MSNDTPAHNPKLDRNRQGQNRIKATAQRWRELGSAPIPMRVDGSKAPATEWKRYQSEQPSEAQIETWFGLHRGLGIVTGVGGIELLEFETEPVFVRWVRDMVAEGHADDLRKICDGYLARSGGGGWHLIYRTPEPGRNTRLACVDKSNEDSAVFKGFEHGAAKTSMVLIETRGVGGFAVVAGGDPAVHATGRPYERSSLPEYLVAEPLRNWRLDPDKGVVLLDRALAERRRGGGYVGGLLSPAPDRLHEVSADLRDTMFSMARLQDQRVPKAAKSERRSELSSRVGQGVPGARPGDAWAAVTTWDEILCPHGWRRDHSTAESDRWTRPGKASGTSATTNFDGSGLLYVFSSSTVFETGDDETYSKFGAYAQLNFDGDMEAAASDLVKKGFADPLRSEADTREHRVAQLAVEAEMRMEAQEIARRNRAVREWRAPITRSGLTAINDPAVEPPHLVEGLVIGEGVTLLSAQNKTGKSTVGVNIVKAVVSGQPLFGKLTTHLDTGNVGIWNAEVSTATYEHWCREHGVFDDEADAARVHFYHCVGDHVDIEVPVWREWAITWLRDNDVKFWVLDPFSKIIRGNEDKAEDVNPFWAALREIMKEAGCRAAFVIHHAGHGVEGMRARARGSSAIEGDPEVILSYEHGGKPGDFPPDDRRYLSGVGRIDVVDRLNLTYDRATRTLRVDENSGGKVADRQVHDDLKIACAAWKMLAGKDSADAWVSKQKLKEADTGIGHANTIKAIDRCVARGYLVLEPGSAGKPDKIRRGRTRPKGFVETVEDGER